VGPLRQVCWGGRAAAAASLLLSMLLLVFELEKFAVSQASVDSGVYVGGGDTVSECVFYLYARHSAGRPALFYMQLRLSVVGSGRIMASILSCISVHVDVWRFV
jgi:hypothetical protein